MVDASYLAGFLDGEGCLSVGIRLKKYITPLIQVTNTHKGVLDELAATFGGKVYSQPQHDPRGSRRPAYLWTAAGQKALAIIRAASPYLIVKREQAEIVLNIKRYTGIKRDSLGRICARLTPEDLAENQRIIASIRALNRRGVSS